MSTIRCEDCHQWRAVEGNHNCQAIDTVTVRRPAELMAENAELRARVAQLEEAAHGRDQRPTPEQRARITELARSRALSVDKATQAQADFLRLAGEQAQPGGKD